MREGLELSDLYTTMTGFKMAARNRSGQSPSMTPLTREARAVLDASRVDGMGGLKEDAADGLYCPVFGCTHRSHLLKRHADRHHKDLGGAAGLKRLLDIPSSAALISVARREILSARLRAAESSRSPEEREQRRRNLSTGRTPASRAKAAKARSDEAGTMGVRNLRVRCDAQMRDALVGLQVKLGRAPTEREAECDPDVGAGFVWKMKDLYGSFAAALAQFGLDITVTGRRRPALMRRFTMAAVVESLSAYYERHGDLPTQKHAKAPTHGPLIPSRSTILKCLGTFDWDEAMRRVASILDIRGGRYGLPEKKTA